MLLLLKTEDAVFSGEWLPALSPTLTPKTKALHYFETSKPIHPATHRRVPDGFNIKRLLFLSQLKLQCCLQSLKKMNTHTIPPPEWKSRCSLRKGTQDKADTRIIWRGGGTLRRCSRPFTFTTVLYTGLTGWFYNGYGLCSLRGTN